MPKSPWDKPPQELDALGPEASEYLRYLHETVFGVGAGGIGKLDATNLGVDYSKTTRTGKSPVLVADPTTGKLKAATGIPFGDLDVDADGILVGSAGAGEVAGAEKASPYINHRLTADYNPQEHFPVDDETEFDYTAGPEVDQSRTSEITWSTKKIQDYVRDPYSQEGKSAEGEVTGSMPSGSNVFTLTIGEGVVSPEKLAPASQAEILLGKGSDFSTDLIEEITLGPHLKMTGTQLDADPDSFLIPGGGASYELDGTDFDGIQTIFTNALVSEPDLTGGRTVFIYIGGRGLFTLTTGTPGKFEFALSGTTNRDVEFGQAPEAGEKGVAFYAERTVNSAPRYLFLTGSTGTLPAGQVPFVLIVGGGVSGVLPAGAAGCKAVALTPASGADAVMELTKGGATFGTVTFPAGGGTPTFSVASDVSISEDDVIYPVNPSPANATLAGIGLTLRIEL